MCVCVFERERERDGEGKTGRERSDLADAEDGTGKYAKEEANLYKDRSEDDSKRLVGLLLRQYLYFCTPKAGAFVLVKQEEDLLPAPQQATYLCPAAPRATCSL